ncbi:hypothetical protein TM7_0189 [candidate division TM7 genomosp. GTL1]|nr:hypothetical protein TM7_0189 [candidate division TM7 genomosp. GTL1]
MIDFLTLGETARGTIQPSTSQLKIVDELTERLQNDEFYITTDERIPRRCIDGRSPAVGGFHDAAPNSAGGSLTLLVADELIGRHVHVEGESTAADLSRLLKTLKQKGYQVGGHTDTHAHGNTSGCGANDKLPAILQFVSEHDTVIRETAAALNVVVDEPTHRQIVEGTKKSRTFASGAEILSVLRAEAGQNVDILDGDHNEGIVVINTRPGTTLDRNSLKKVYGSDLQAFNVDIWSFGEAARAIAREDNEAAQKAIAMVYYNLATAFVLGGPNLRVMVR